VTLARTYEPRRFPSGGTYRRHVTSHGKKTPIVLRDEHAAIVDARTLFPSTRTAPPASGRVLKSGVNQRKLGKMVIKGRWRGFPIYALTLEERATCPRSCLNFDSCYGNAMHFAHRMVHGEAFEDALAAQLVDLAADHPQGFVVRLHILGDFYSVDYVGIWERALATLPELNVFGFTARQPEDPIGAAVREVARRFGPRFAMRWSGSDGEMGAVTIERGEETALTICPAQLRDDKFCGSCGLCWHSRDAIAFRRH